MYRFSQGTHNVRNRDGGVVLDVPHDRIFRVNACGAAILESVERGLSEEEIAEQIAAQYAVQLEIAHSDVREFLESLAASGVLLFSKTGPSV